MKQLSPATAVSVLGDQNEKEEALRISKLRSSFRLLVELYLVGIAQDTATGRAALIPLVMQTLVGNTLKTYLYQLDFKRSCYPCKY